MIELKLFAMNVVISIIIIIIIGSAAIVLMAVVFAIVVGVANAIIVQVHSPTFFVKINFYSQMIQIVFV